MMSRLITTEQAIAKLDAEAKRISLRGLARCLDVDAGNLCHVIAGRKDPEYMLRRFGYERIIRYRHLTRGKEG